MVERKLCLDCNRPKYSKGAIFYCPLHTGKVQTHEDCLKVRKNKVKLHER